MSDEENERIQRIYLFQVDLEERRFRPRIGPFLGEIRHFSSSEVDFLAQGTKVSANTMRNQNYGVKIFSSPSYLYIIFNIKCQI